MKAEDRNVCVFCSLGSRPFKVGEMEFQFLLGRSFGLKYWEFQRLKKAKYSVILEQHQFLATANPRGGKRGPKVAGVLKNRVFQKSWFNLMICKPLSTKGFVVMECVVFCLLGMSMFTDLRDVEIQRKQNELFLKGPIFKWFSTTRQ